jgi:parallel beta-helix repeat protein
MNIPSLRWLALSLSAIASTQAGAETTQCTAITRLPTVITAQGVHCLKTNLGTSIRTGAAIRIATSNVTLDFNGYRLGGLAGGLDTNADGVKIGLGQRNVQIRNGAIRGFRRGILVAGGYGHLVEDMLLDGNRKAGLWAENFSGSPLVGLVARRNRVIDTGGTTLSETDPSVYGMMIRSGTEVRLIDNDVMNTTRNGAETGLAYGMRVISDAAVVEDNRVSNSADRGIYSSNNSAVLIAGNRITNRIPGGQVGLRMNSSDSSLYQGNMVSGFAIPYTGGTDGGGNVSLP